MAGTGVFTFTPADPTPPANCVVAVQVCDGAAPSLCDTQSTTIAITAVNDAPSFTGSNPPTVHEDAPAVTIPAWATSFDPGPPDESGQTVLGYTVVAISNPALFAAAPAVANNGTLTYTLAPNQNGSSTFTVRVQDSGGTASGGVDLSAPQTFTITVAFVNDAPSFTAGPNQTVNEDAGPQTVNPWAIAIDDGDPEVVENLAFNVIGNTNPTLFSAGPSIDATGVLTYTPAANANGTATMTLNLPDDSGTAMSGVDTSAAQSFTITVNAVNDAPLINSTAPTPAVEDTLYTYNATRSDDDGPAQTWSLLGTHTCNGAIVAGTGEFTFTPTGPTPPTNCVVAIQVCDGGSPNLCGTQTTTVAITAVSPPPCYQSSVGVNSGNPWVVCAADANTAWVAANTSGNYNAIAICQFLGYTSVANQGGTCGNVCGYCQGPTSCMNPGNMTFDGAGGNPASMGNSVHWRCSN